MRARPCVTTALVVTVLVAASCGSIGRKSVAVLGDSIIQWNRNRIEAELEGCCKPDVEGFSGARADQMVDAAKSVAEARPRVAIINLGTNDALQVGDPNRTRLAMTGIIQTFSASRCIYLVNVSTSIGGAPNVNAKADQINTVAATINTIYDELAAADPKVEVIDWNATIVDAFTQGRDLTRDRVHPNEEGLVALADEFRGAVRRCLG